MIWLNGAREDGGAFQPAWRRMTMNLAVFMPSALALLGCADSGDSLEGVGESESRLTLQSDEYGPAKGPIVAQSVDEDGLPICSKSDGGPFTSALGGRVDFFLRDGEHGAWFLAGTASYPPQPLGGGDLYEIVPDPKMFVQDVLGEGTGHGAQCRVTPNIDISEDPNWKGELCLNDAGEYWPCTSSGVYSFDLVDSASGAGDAAEHGNCGNGKGQGLVLCVGKGDVATGVHDHAFDCVGGRAYEAKLVTTKGSTSLTLFDSDGTQVGVSQSRGAVDRISMLAPTDGTCLARVEAWEPSRAMLQIKDEHGNHGAVASKKWTVVVDAGHGKVPEAGSTWLSSTCIDDKHPSGNADDETAKAERILNKQITAAVHAHLDGAEHPQLPPSRYDVVDYDDDVLPRVADFLSMAGGDALTTDDLRWRETQLAWGCDAYRGYLIRLWAREMRRAADHVVVVQIHNDTLSLFEDLGAEAAHYGRNGGDVYWLSAMRRAVSEDLGEEWLGEIPITAGNAAFVRGASGVTMCSGSLALEADSVCPVESPSDYGGGGNINISTFEEKYGPGVRASVLLEVAHFDADGLLFAGTDVYSSDGVFIETVGTAIGDRIISFLTYVTLP